jgi:thiamine-monophosphate kinase
MAAARGTEREALELLARLLPAPPCGQTWFGDDAAVVSAPGGGQMLLASDTLVGGVDADFSLTTLADFGWKAMAVNLSDIAAMGGRPAYAVLSVVGLAPSGIGELYEGVLEAASAYGCPVVGGDLSAGEALVVSVAVTGHVEGRAVLRSGARPGDSIWVTGALGAAAAGLRCLRAARGGAVEPLLAKAHARPVPALAEGAAAREAGATAMIDVSDGLVSDLGALARSSGVGFELEAVPVAPSATLEEALGGGDDYALVFTLPAGVEPANFPAAGLPPPFRLGVCVPDPGHRRLAGAELPSSGFTHALATAQGTSAKLAPRGGPSELR